MRPTLVLRPEQEPLVAAYTRSLAAAGFHPRLWPARTFCSQVGLPADWEALTLAEQCGLPPQARAFVAWLLVTGRVAARADYLVQADHRLGNLAAAHHRRLHAEFTTTAAQLGFRPDAIRRQWAQVVTVAVLHKVPPDRLTTALIAEGRAALEAAWQRRRPTTPLRQSPVKALFGAEATLFQLGIVEAVPRKRAPSGIGQLRATEWTEVAPGLATTMRGYLEQLALSQRPTTVTHTEQALRELGSFLARQAPEVQRVADLRRAHLERYKIWLAERPVVRGARRGRGTLARPSIRNRLALLQRFFQRLLEWGGEDQPIGPLLLRGDLPLLDRPLPRFLDDPTAAKLLVAARADPDPFVRLVVELLARTGLRKGELVGLRVDAVVQIGSAYWLRTPVGKLHEDRYVPLHPQLKTLLDEWVARRPPGLRSSALFVERGRRITSRRVDFALEKVAQAAGIGHVTPHQLRHTLATQAINRGMSLEAIAALLGHKTLGMTLVYARIADRTVANEYFSVTEKVEALYNQPRQLPAEAEGSEMAKLRREMNRRMLGNGYCARPVELDCHFESICESCTFFVTTLEFKPTLERQRDDAAQKGQLGRQRIFEGLIARLDREAS